MKDKLLFLTALITALTASSALADHRGSKLDADGDGEVTQAEIDAYVADAVDNAVTKTLARFDTPLEGSEVGDGIITSEEAMAVHEERVAGWLEHVLAIYDSNEDGVIDGDDASPRMRRGHRGLDNLDVDGDGTITIDDLNASAAEKIADLVDAFSARYDSDEDGNVTTEEITAAALTSVQARIARFQERQDAGEGERPERELREGEDGERPEGRPSRRGRRGGSRGRR